MREKWILIHTTLHARQSAPQYSPILLWFIFSLLKLVLWSVAAASDGFSSLSARTRTSRARHASACCKWYLCRQCSERRRFRRKCIFHSSRFRDAFCVEWNPPRPSFHYIFFLFFFLFILRCIVHSLYNCRSFEWFCLRPKRMKITHNAMRWNSLCVHGMLLPAKVHYLYRN